MTSGRLSIVAAAGVFGVLALSGCSSLNPFASKRAAAATPIAAPPPPAKAAPAANTAAVLPTIDDESSARLPNVFGEFADHPRVGATGGSGTAVQQHTACDEGYDADVAVDPTGKMIAFTSTRHNEHPDIYLQRVDGNSVVQLTSDPADDAQPAFSPDGKRIAFCSTRAGTWDIYIMDVDGRNVEQITSSPAQEMHPSFSPDGSRLVYCSMPQRGDQWELWVINLTTRERKMIGQGLFPAWSPKADRIAFQRARQRGSRWFSIWTMDLVDGEPRRVTEVAASSNAAVVSPSWSPDGSRLAFTTILSPGGSAARKRVGQDVWVVSTDGNGRQRLTEGTGTNLSPFWGVDNRIYFISDRSGRENVWSVRIDGPAVAQKPEPPVRPAGKTETNVQAPIGTADAR